jgi:SAM-dependent methyltransferase
LSTLAYPLGLEPNVGSFEFGPNLSSEVLDRLIGNVEGKRILEVGVGNGSNAVALALAGARVIAVDSDADRVAAARALAEQHGVRIELHHGDLAELPFIRADAIDMAFSIYSLQAVEDLGRVFRQVERVLRNEGTLTVTLPHPLEYCTDADSPGALRISRSLFSEDQVGWSGAGVEGTIYAHSLSTVFREMSRSNLRVDMVLEPQPTVTADSPYRSSKADWIPATLVIRGRKEGV